MLTQQQKDQLVNELVTNCDCWRHPGDRELLAGMADDKLQHLADVARRDKQALAVANVAAAGFSDGAGTAYRVNPETGRWERKVTGNAGKRKPTANYDEDDDEEDEDEEEVRNTNRRRLSTNRRPVTTDEWLRQAPAEVQNAFRHAQEVEQREKDALATQLLANVAEADKRAHYDRLMRRPLEDLRQDVALMPKQPSPEEMRRAGWGGDGARLPTSNIFRDEDVLNPPVIDWQNEGNGVVAANGGGERTEVGTPSLAMASEDEWLRSAPPGIRAAVQNALSLENRERKRLIEEIVANVDDPDNERRLRARLERKPLDELKDMLLITPSKPTGTPYFGSVPARPGVPAPTTTTNAREASEDVLPLPSMDWKSISEEGRRKAE